ncbi:hypothetical protein [Diaphorobacter nitroreducens]
MHYLPNTIPDEAADALRPAFDHSDDQCVEDWIQRCKDDLAQLWRLRDYWIISELRQTRHGLAVHLTFSAGVYEPELVDEVNAWAKSLGCVRSYFSGRPGCARRRPDYRLRYITMDKEL